MGKKGHAKGKVQSPKHLQKRTNYCKKCSQAWLVKLLYSTFYIEHFKHSWIVFQEKYEVFRHLIKDKDSKNETTIKLINSMDKYVFSSLHLINMSLFI